MEWTVTDQDTKLSEIAVKALQEGRQRINTDDGVVVVLSEEELERIEENSEKNNDFLEFLKSGPSLEGVDTSRDKSPLREIDW